MTVIYALWLRELRRYLRLKAQLLASLAQPLIYLLVLGFGLSPVFRQSGAGRYIEFITPGVIALTVLFSSLFSGAQLIWERQFGFLREMMVAPVSRTHIMIGRTSGAATAALLQGVLVALISAIAGFRPASLLAIPLALGFVACIALIFTALGTIIGATLKDMQGFQAIVNLIVMPLYFLSGALFPLQHLPGFLTALTVGDPLSYGVDGLRGALTSQWHFTQMTDVAVVSGLLILLMGIGALRFSRIET